jgi:hypothetical protein
MSLVVVIDELLDSLIEVDYKFKIETLKRTSKPDPLSKDELKQRIAEILSQGSKLKALSSNLSKTKRRPLRQGSIELPSQANATNPRSSHVELEGLTSLRLLCARFYFIGHLKHHLWRIITNIQSNKIESFENEVQEQGKDLDDEDHDDEKMMSRNRSSSTADSLLRQLDNLPFVPMSSEISSWNTSPSLEQVNPPSTTSEQQETPSKSQGKSSQIYSIRGLGMFLVQFQRLYYLFMEVRLQFQESQDQNAIMKAASFIESLDHFTREYKISLDSNLLMTSFARVKASKDPVSDRSDIMVASFTNMPDWICPRYGHSCGIFSSLHLSVGKVSLTPVNR